MIRRLPKNIFRPNLAITESEILLMAI